MSRWKAAAIGAAVVLAGCRLPAVGRAVRTEHGVEYRGGRWFDGTRFVPRTMYVADGVLRRSVPLRVDSVVDLAGGYVVPPFGDAHHHRAIGVAAGWAGDVSVVPEESLPDHARGRSPTTSRSSWTRRERVRSLATPKRIGNGSALADRCLAPPDTRCEGARRPTRADVMHGLLAQGQPVAK